MTQRRRQPRREQMFEVPNQRIVRITSKQVSVRYAKKTIDLPRGRVRGFRNTSFLIGLEFALKKQIPETLAEEAPILVGKYRVIG